MSSGNDDGDDLFPTHLKALLGGDGGRLRAEIGKLRERSAGRLSTSRVGRAFKMSTLAGRSGGRLAFDRLKQVFSGEPEVLVGDHGLALAADMLETFSELRGVAMKLGQMVSYIDDSLPPDARRLLAMLQRDAPALPFDQIAARLDAELGQPHQNVFVELDPTPLAAASIGQVHRGRLAEGTEVAVKIQYPGIDRAMAADLKNAKVASLFKQALFLNTDLKAITDELEERFLDECNYLKEAEYQEAFGARFLGHPVITIPAVKKELCTRHVLVTTFERGRTFYEWLQSGPSAEERSRVTRTIYRFYLGSFYLDGIFNCDPHPGNYLFRDDGRIVFVDFGCCRRFTDARRQQWIKMARTVRQDEEEALQHMGREMGFLLPGANVDRAAFRELLRWIYAPYLEDGPYDFSQHKPLRTFQAMFTQNRNLFQLNMPADAVFLNRITFGLVSLLAQIGAPLDCYRTASAYFDGRDPDWPEDP